MSHTLYTATSLRFKKSHRQQQCPEEVRELFFTRLVRLTLSTDHFWEWSSNPLLTYFRVKLQYFQDYPTGISITCTMFTKKISQVSYSSMTTGLLVPDI